jgi:DNA repair exonuclease SbcCD ATPase subunit
MRINEVFIQRYGPLRPFHAKFKKNVCIVFGPGGSGKTLTIDAVLKILLGENAEEFIRHDEVEETPTGYLVIEKDGKEFKLGEEKHLSDIPGLEIDPTELKNIFVIQDADLGISDEDKFYGRVTSKLMGVRTGDIRRVEDELRKRGRLTPKLEILDKHPHKFRTRLNDAKELQDDIGTYVEKAKSEGIDKLEKEKFDIKWDLKSLEESIELLEKAKKKLEFNKLETAFNEAKQILQELKALPDKDGISQLNAKLLDSKKEKVKLPQLEIETKSWKKRFQYLTISTAISFAGLMAFSRELAFSIIPFILLFASLFSIYKWHQSDKSLTRVVTIERSLLEEAQALRIEAKTVEEAEGKITQIIKETEEKQATFNQKKGILGKDLQINEKETEKFLEKAKNALTKIRQSIDLNISLDYDEEKLEEAKKQKKGNEASLGEVEKRLQEHQKTMTDFSERAQQLQFTDEFSNFKLDIEIRNLESLEKLVRWLNQYIEQIEKDAELSIKAFEIFKELESKEKAKSEELFEKDNQASMIFRDITSGMFEDISYDSSAGEILVKRSHEKRLQKASELSRSEWTQLYTAIRIALGEKLLKGEKGFFIVEDPFIHADPERLLKEFDMLKNLSERGWQTIYFTAKDEIKKGLPKQINVEIIELERLP